MSLTVLTNLKYFSQKVDQGIIFKMMFLSIMVNRILWKIPFIKSIHITQVLDLKICNYVHQALDQSYVICLFSRTRSTIATLQVFVSTKGIIKKNLFYNLITICYYMKNIPLSFYVDLNPYIKVSLMDAYF